ncbi:MAG: hypothetical protein ACQEW9_13085 [Bacteroidota bacterium]
MADKKTNTPQWSDPKDYGLPFVEVKSLSDVSQAPDESPTGSSPKEVKEDLSAAALRAKTAHAVKPVITHEPLAEEDEIFEEKGQVEKASPVEKIEKKKSNWAVYVVFVGLLLISTVVWQLMKEEESSPNVLITGDNLESLSLSEMETGNEDVKNSLAEEEEMAESEPVEVKEEIPIAESSTNEESGTTIEQVSTGSLIRVESKATRPQYFIVVGSLPNERLAIQESSQYYDRVEELFLISPYDDVPNYRLAIGKFTSFTQANNELEQVKDQYTEALWILKY